MNVGYTSLEVSNCFGVRSKREINNGQPVRSSGGRRIRWPGPPRKGDPRGISAEDITKIQGDVASLAELKKQMETLKADFDKRLHELETESEKRLHKLETEAEQRLHKLESNTDKQVAQVETSIGIVGP
jgi:hypothetical protein